MLKFALLIFLSTFIGTISSFGAIAIDFAIDAKGGSFGWNTELDPRAYERIPPAQKAEFFREGTKKAELYCRQALGLGVTIQNEKCWISYYQESSRSQLVLHNIRIRCMKALDLEEDDPFIGKYLDHARFLLSNFSSLKLADENHQLAANTLKILVQIGAPAKPLLWDLNRQKIENGEKSSLLDTVLVIAQKDTNALSQIIDIIGQCQSKERAYREDLMMLFRKSIGKQEVRWPLIEKAIIKNINEMIYDTIFTYSFANNLTTLSYIY